MKIDRPTERNRQTDEQTVRQVDRQMDGWMDRYQTEYPHTYVWISAATKCSNTDIRTEMFIDFFQNRYRPVNQYI